MNQRGMTLWGKTLNSTANQNKLLVKKYSGHLGTLGSQIGYPGTLMWSHGTKHF